jgi:hypothetical protein
MTTGAGANIELPFKWGIRPFFWDERFSNGALISSLNPN